MRLFIAADLPPEVMESLAATQSELRSTVRGRYCAPDSFHVTLAFLGETPAACIPTTIDAMERACARHSAIEAHLGQLGHFGKAHDATLWQGFTEPAPFENLARDVRRELTAAGLAFDTKPPKAHVTLMRRADLSCGIVPMPAPGSGRVDAVTLYQSELSPSGPRYTPLHTTVLR